MIDLGYDELTAHELLAGGLDDLVAENSHAARRMARLYAFHALRQRDHLARKAQDPHFTLTPLQETSIEASELWGLTTGQVQRHVAVADALVSHFPGVWDLCQTGQLGLYKASIITETASAAVDDDVLFARLADRITPWLVSRIPPEPSRRGLVGVTVPQLRAKLRYELAKLRPRHADERFKRAFKDRRATAHPLGDGIGLLSLTGSVDDVQRADYRLTLIAKARRAQGDTRTVEQLRTDLAFDLLVGRLEVGVGLADLQDADDSGDPQTVRRVRAAIRTLPLPAFARPVINVTVPIQTLMGVTDDPGSLSGGEVIPASLARMIAMQPGSTWHRLLTDPRDGPPGSVLERSTASYRPTRPIWLDVVARDGTCFRANCGTPSTACELDHKVPYPRGATSTGNLHAACRTDHKAKHARGFGLGTGEDGSATFHTRAGFVHHIPPTEHPTGEDAAWSRMSDLLDDFSETGLSATEFLDTLEHLRRTTGRPAANEPMVAEIRALRADYAAAYPDATDEEIDYWIFGDPFEDEEDHFRPPLTVAADATESVVPLRRVG